MQVVPLQQPNSGTAKRNGKPSLWFGLANTCTCTLMGSLSQSTQIINPWWPSIAIQVPNLPQELKDGRWGFSHTRSQYRRGETNPADYLSRHPTMNAAQTTRQQKVAEEYINYLAPTSTPKALKTQDIEAATQADATLQGGAEAVAKGNWHLVCQTSRC